MEPGPGGGEGDLAYGTGAARRLGRLDLLALGRAVRPGLLRAAGGAAPAAIAAGVGTAGEGAGAVAAGVYFGPLLVGVLTAIAANLALLALVASVCAWGVVTVVKSVGGTSGKTGRKSR
ncbi:DUF6251 family protein [Streptomyces griseus]|uniref:DUF6251 family protein n=1 Tax=Streptomyces griseus TaxID=1911 RepID=UPI0027E0227C|nr:DUF6251 family protein [Streptomyces griseus]